LQRPVVTAEPHLVEQQPVRPRRLGSLDGLRGVAALIVVFCHCILVAPVLLSAYIDPTLISKGSWAWWAAFSPLHLLWAGREAVLLFFVLSGFVLTLPFVRGWSAGWISYYPKRLLRLYLPVWGACALFLIWVALFPRNFTSADPAWLQLQMPNLTAEAIRADLILLPGAGGNNPVLWSLTMEVIFSLALPLYIAFVRFLPKLNWLKLALLLGLLAFSSHTPESLQFFVPVFGLGVLMAAEYDRIRAWGHRIRSDFHGNSSWWILGVGSLLLLNSRWTTYLMTTDPKRLAIMLPLAACLSILGACLAIFMALEGPWRKVLERPALSWLGTRSFSLYLVHAPIIVSAGVVLGQRVSAITLVALALPVSLVVAELFHRAVERPGQYVSRAVERLIGRIRTSRPGTTRPGTTRPGTARPGTLDGPSVLELLTY
jgi:peptidoglycan/LPS O-acetylase OafA/YrhL